MMLDFSFSGWVRQADVEHVYETVSGRKLIVDTDLGEDEVRLINMDSSVVLYEITFQEFKDRLGDGRFSLDLSEMLEANCHKSEREIFDFDNVQV